jgi:hypothetical protein
VTNSSRLAWDGGVDDVSVSLATAALLKERLPGENNP